MFTHEKNRKQDKKEQENRNRTGIPDKMKERFEAVSGFSFDDVNVHYNSGKPSRIGALAYTQGNHVYIAPGQERHLSHEMGHVVQQKKGIVKATGRINGMPLNDSPELEAGADRIGEGRDRVRSEAIGQETVNGEAVQRILDPASDPGLAVLYNGMVHNSPTFRQLDDTVSPAELMLRLVDSSGIAGQPVDYDPDAHVIRVPLNQPAAAVGAAMAPRPFADVRGNLLWEMHNAKNRPSFKRIGNVFGTPNDTVAKAKEYSACFALSCEWGEWINILEQVVRADRINAEMGAGTVTNGFRPFFIDAMGAFTYGQGWFRFDNYLKSQILGGHTRGYDAAAVDLRWIGYQFMLRKANPDSAALIVTQKQVKDYLQGKKNIKNSSNNPFTLSFLKDYNSPRRSWR